MQRLVWSLIDFKLGDIKLESSEAYLLKLWKNPWRDFEVIYIFCKNLVLNLWRYLKHFYTYKKIYNIFLKFDHSLLRIPKIIENTIQNHNRHAYK